MAVSEEAFQALLGRVEALEQAQSPAPAEPAARPRPPVGELDPQQIDQLRNVPGSGEIAGAVRIIGAVRIADQTAAWQADHHAEEVFELDPDRIAQVLSALAHPLRLRLMRALLAGPKRAGELDAEVGAHSAGRLYHHLEKLTQAGLVVQPQRGTYQARKAAVVPVIAMMGAAGELGVG